MPALSDLVLSQHDPDPVATALATSGSGEFLSALHWVNTKTSRIETEKLPASLRMLRVLWWLQFEADRIEFFIFSGERGFAPWVAESAEAAREIGATKAAALLDDIQALFTKKVPRSYEEWMRMQKGTKLRQRAEQLGETHAGFASELGDALRAWLTANADLVRREIAAIVGPRKPLSVEEAAAQGATPVAESRDAGVDPAALDAVLATSDGDPLEARLAFMRAAIDWAWSVPERKKLPFDALPETARMIIGLNGLVSALHSSGLLYVGDWELGDDFAELRAWAEQVGATRTVRYLDGFAKLFPRGRVPTDRDKRSEALRRAVEKAAKKGPDPLDALDDEFRETALVEIPQRLREWMTLHRARFEREQLHAAAQPEGSSGDDVLLDDRNFLSLVAASEARLDEELRAGKVKEPARPGIGDVVALKTPKGFAYLQVTHDHALARTRGPVVRLVEGFTERPLEGAELARHVAGPTRRFVLLAVARYLEQKPELLSLVGRGLPVPASARDFPTFLFKWGTTRDGRPVFGIWEGGERPTGQVIGLLTEAQLRMSVARFGPTLETLAEEIAEGETPARELLAYFPG